MTTFTDLKDKKILITGSNKGIGFAIAKELQKQGAHIIAQYRSETEDLNKLGENDNVTLLQCDLLKFDEVTEKVGAFIKEHGPIDSLVNNAGVSKDTLSLRVKEEELDFVLGTNLKAVMQLTNYMTRNFLKVPTPNVVFISSVVGLMGNTAQTSYSASKAGIIGYAKSLAKELSSKNLRSNVICPGFIDTDMTQKLGNDVREGYLSEIPLGRFGKPEDVANLTSFLLSECSSYITGEVIKIDGGLYI